MARLDPVEERLRTKPLGDPDRLVDERGDIRSSVHRAAVLDKVEQGVGEVIRAADRTQLGDRVLELYVGVGGARPRRQAGSSERAFGPE